MYSTSNGYHCQICQEELATRDHLEQHRRTYTAVTTTVKCVEKS